EMAINMRFLFRNINRAFYCSTSKHNVNSEKTIPKNDAIKDWRIELYDTMKVLPNFINEKEEDILVQEVDPYMKRLRYEFSHWDNVKYHYISLFIFYLLNYQYFGSLQAIHGYRETEWSKWSEDSSQILDRVRRKAFLPEMIQLSLVHILDLAPEGWIKPHIDSVRRTTITLFFNLSVFFCGGIIAGLSLLSDSVMRLAMEGHEKECVACFLLPRRSLYIMSGIARYKYNHEILKSEESYFEGRHVPKGRRISVICRSEADPEVT
ncbi:putative alpha-ketoglutarate-dependent dioxygenase ABH7, partial [Cyphomyrmex costatus]